LTKNRAKFSPCPSFMVKKERGGKGEKGKGRGKKEGLFPSYSMYVFEQKKKKEKRGRVGGASKTFFSFRPTREKEGKEEKKGKKGGEEQEKSLSS